MAIVTLLTDSGESDHYVAAIKAKIISINPGIRVEDITHNIKPSDIAHAAFVLKCMCFAIFPKELFTWLALIQPEIKAMHLLRCNWRIIFLLAVITDCLG